MYSVIKIYLDAQFALVHSADFSPAGTGTIDKRPVNIFVKKLGIPGSFPIFLEQEFSLSDPPIKFSLTEEALEWPDFLIGYEIRAPGFVGSKIFRIVHQPKGTLWIVDEVSTSDQHKI